ncbi:hypothetical protein RUM44_009067 [Polyplax serrata]|uniref:Uncharacterized protein n=1 Tax=Polyplax serrata TaxID=468196 RepID=A0ABR1ARL9_POLSC
MNRESCDGDARGTSKANEEIQGTEDEAIQDGVAMEWKAVYELREIRRRQRDKSKSKGIASAKKRREERR